MLIAKGCSDRIDDVVRRVITELRIPGAALAIVMDRGIAYANAYGYRDLHARLPMTVDTLYPIGSTSKGINATLLGTLIDEGRLEWDRPIRAYFPAFRLGDAYTSAQVTLRDLVVMRTGLARHDWLWIDSPIQRSELMVCLPHLDLACGFRERHHYCNLSVVAAGFLAELVAGQTWEGLIQDRILGPLGMHSTRCEPPPGERVTVSYHESPDRELRPRRALAAQATAPSGGAIYSNVLDMARWIEFNLHGPAGTDVGINVETLAEIHSPQVVIRRGDTPELMNRSSYGLGWGVGSFAGEHCLFHGGYLHDVNSDLMLLPGRKIGIVSFTNFGFPTAARLINQQVCDLLIGSNIACTTAEKATRYDRHVAANAERIAAARRVGGTMPSHRLEDYVGRYIHPGYGALDIVLAAPGLQLKRHSLQISLEHWHYDAWVAGRDSETCTLHVPHVFDRSNRLSFHTGSDGVVEALSIPFETTTAPVRFLRRLREIQYGGRSR